MILITLLYMCVQDIFYILVLSIMIFLITLSKKFHSIYTVRKCCETKNGCSILNVTKIYFQIKETIQVESRKFSDIYRKFPQFR